MSIEEEEDGQIVYIYSQEIAKCAFWQDTGPHIGWSSGGCEVASGNTTHTVCFCHQLSTFAVLLPTSSLLAVDGVTPGDYHPGVFTYVALSLSCLLLLLAILALWVIRWSSGNVYVTVYKNLLLSLLLTALLFLTGINRTQPELLCFGFAVLLDFFLVSCLFWMLVMGVVISRMLLHPPPKRASCLVTVCMMAGLWAIPSLMCVIPVGIVAMSSSNFSEDVGYPNYCLIAPEMALVLLTPITLLLILIIIALVVVLILMKSSKRDSSDTHTTPTTPTGLSANRRRTRRHFGIISATLCLYLVSWGAGLLAIYGHAFPGPIRDVLEITFAISHTALSVFLFVIHCLNKKVVSSVRARFESKYQNSSTLAVSGSNSLLSRHRVAGRRGEERGDGSGQSLPQQGYSRDRHHHHQLRARFEARNHVVVQEELGDLNGVDLARMEANPRTPNNNDALYSQRQRSPAISRGPVAPPAAVFPAVYPPRTSQRRTNTNPPQTTAVVHTHLLNAPPTASSGGEADLDTDGVGGGDRPWYCSASELSDDHSTDIDYPLDNDSSRIDPSCVSTTSKERAVWV